MAHSVIVHGKPLTCVNEDERFWKHYYQVGFASSLGWDSSILVNADHEQDAADAAADYAESMGWSGYFVPMADIPENELEDYCTVGNHCLQVQSEELHIRQVEID